ncbi:unnamed protein product, partial [Heterosigma akashiwo]
GGAGGAVRAADARAPGRRGLRGGPGPARPGLGGRWGAAKGGGLAAAAGCGRRGAEQGGPGHHRTAGGRPAVRGGREPVGGRAPDHPRPPP